MYNPDEIKGFYHKSSYLGLSSNLFKNVMQQQGGIHPMAQCQKPCAKILFLVCTYVWQEDVAKIFKVPGALRNVNPARAIT